MLKQTKIYIRPIPGSLMNEIFITEKYGDPSNGGHISIFNFKENGEGVATEAKSNHGEIRSEDMKPTMILPEQETRDLIRAFSELASERGFEPDSESKAKGKLEATERHLADLRTLLKLK